MDTVAETYHLKCRKGVWYYRRRVPDHLVGALGKAIIQHSLDTKSLKQAKRRREVADIEWSARFAAAEGAPPDARPVPIEQTASAVPHMSNARLKQLVWDYVARTDARFQERIAADPPESEEDKSLIKMNIEETLQVHMDRDDPNGAASIYITGNRILGAAGIARDQLGAQASAFHELVRRALIELDRRRLAHNADDHCRQTFDELFNREKPPKVAFSELAKQRLQRIQEEASSNHISDKWIRKQDAIVTFLREVVGDATPIADIDYDACMRVQAAVAHVPANRTKLYEGIPLEQAIARAKHEGKPTLLPATQEVYLATFTSILDLAAKKRLISVNPAAGLKPLKRDVVADEDKCHPFTQEQLIQLFHCDYYQQCAASGPVPYRFATDGGWRYWLPLIFLFSGMRPNEICQLHFADIRRTKAGTPYFEVTNATDEKGTPGPKTLKTQTSRRRVPVHTELVRLGIFEFIEDRRAATAEPYIFPLKPDRDGNRAWYPLKRFRESYLPKALTLSPRQSFYSFRHTVRDALRRIHAPADTLQAVCGWSQGRLVSDNYGERSNPDYQHSWVEKIAYLGLDLAHLYIKTSAGGEN